MTLNNNFLNLIYFYSNKWKNISIKANDDFSETSKSNSKFINKSYDFNVKKVYK